MATNETKILRDGQLSFIGGSDTGKSPLLIGETRYAYGSNVTCRGGYLGQRAGWFQVGLVFSRDEYYTWFSNHWVQGWGDFNLPGKRTRKLVSVGGRIFNIHTATWVVSELTPTFNHYVDNAAGYTAPAIGSTVEIVVDSITGIQTGYPCYIDGSEYTVTEIDSAIPSVTLTNVGDTAGDAIADEDSITFLDTNPSYLPMAWFEQADVSMVIQDGLSLPIIISSTGSRRAIPSLSEVPTGRMMAYGNGRLWVALDDYQYLAGDIVGGPTGVRLHLVHSEYHHKPVGPSDPSC